jgi:hypothetical protein
VTPTPGRLARPGSFFAFFTKIRVVYFFEDHLLFVLPISPDELHSPRSRNAAKMAWLRYAAPPPRLTACQQRAHPYQVLKIGREIATTSAVVGVSRHRSRIGPSTTEL